MSMIGRWLGEDILHILNVRPQRLVSKIFGELFSHHDKPSVMETWWLLIFDDDGIQTINTRGQEGN